MPVMDGLESTRQIRKLERTQQYIPTTIIALTGHASASTQKDAFDSGIDLFLAKPVRLKELAEILTTSPISNRTDGTTDVAGRMVSG